MSLWSANNCAVTPHSDRAPIGTTGLLFALSVLIVGTVWAQPYSGGLADDANAFDAPIPGFVGPAGDGKAPLPGLGHDANAVNPLFAGWATGVADYSPAPGVEAFWGFSGEALGEVTGDAFGVVSLGDLSGSAIASGTPPGSITLTFDRPVSDMPGADFAIFENAVMSTTDTGGVGIGGVFGELAYVEVSSDGETFARFPAISENPEPIGPYGSLDPTRVHNLAGKHINGYGESWGTPFDLQAVWTTPEVQAGTVDITAITHVRLVDIPGSGDFADAVGNPIYDAWQTSGSGGADVEAVGVIATPLTYPAWAAERNLALDGDADMDGATNRQEYAAGTHPRDPFDTPRLRIGKHPDQGLVISFPRDFRCSDMRLVVEMAEHPEATDWIEIATLEPFAEVFTTATIDGASIWISTESRPAQASVGVLQTVNVTVYGWEPVCGFFRVRVEEIADAQR